MAFYAMGSLIAFCGNWAHRDGGNLDQTLADGLRLSNQTSSGRVSLGNGRAVIQTVSAFTTGDDDITNIVLEGGVGVADCLCVGLNLLNTAWDVLVVDGDNRLLGKVLLLGGTAVVVGDSGVLIIGVGPFLAVGEGSAVLGVEGVGIERVASLVDEDGNLAVAVHLDVVAAAAGRALAGQSNDVADELAHTDGQTAKELSHVLLAERRILVATEDPRLLLAVVVVNVEGANVKGRESSVLGKVLAVLREHGIIPIVRGVGSNLQRRHQIWTQTTETAIGEGRLDDRLVQSGGGSGEESRSSDGSNDR